MRLLIAAGCALLLGACQPTERSGQRLDSQSFTGSWYGIRPNGVTTFHSDSVFAADGSIEVHFYTCLSNHYESRWTERGTWVWNNNQLIITLFSADDNEESSTTEYTLVEHEYDRRVYRNEADDYTFWLQRRWRDTPYTCATTRAQVDADRDAAVADGRFNALYPDYTENDT